MQGNGEILSDDFAQLINRNTREVLRIRPGMFGGEKIQHIGILTDSTVVIVTRRDRVGPVFRYPIDFWGFLRTANKPKKLEWREYKEVYQNLPIFLPPKATERKIILKKDSLTILGSVLRRRLPFRSLRESWDRPHCPAKWNTEKPHDWPREFLYPGTCFVGRAWTPGWLDEDEQTTKCPWCAGWRHRESMRSGRHLTERFGSGPRTTGRPAGRISPDLPIPSN